MMHCLICLILFFFSGHRIKAARLKENDAAPKEINNLVEKDVNETVKTEQLPS